MKLVKTRGHYPCCVGPQDGTQQRAVAWFWGDSKGDREGAEKMADEYCAFKNSMGSSPYVQPIKPVVN